MVWKFPCLGEQTQDVRCPHVAVFVGGVNRMNESDEEWRFRGEVWTD